VKFHSLWFLVGMSQNPWLYFFLGLPWPFPLCCCPPFARRSEPERMD
jgi:hypothetical protein